MLKRVLPALTAGSLLFAAPAGSTGTRTTLTVRGRKQKPKLVTSSA